MKITNRDILNNIVANTGRFFLVLSSIKIDHESKVATAVLNKGARCCGYNLSNVENIDAVPLESFVIKSDDISDSTLVSHGYALHIDDKILLGKRPSNISQPNKWTIMGGRCSELPSETGMKETLEEIVIEVTNGVEYGFAYLGNEDEYQVCLAENAINQVEYEDRARAAKWVHCNLEVIKSDADYTLKIYDENDGLLDIIPHCHLYTSDNGSTVDIVTKQRIVFPTGWRFSRAWFLENEETQEASLRTRTEWREISKDEFTLWAADLF
ncbi:NUDIX hydrolase [Vibrio harveyi]|uniref:NUDIX hydrolase n=1 Tax=Vibrio harveyi TaxID=669 RepID=UPI003CFAB8B9